jgi:1-acyl-sn-glycerol-3-phosphate acyltransferase
MNRYRMQFAPFVWKPNLNPSAVGWLCGLRLRHQRRSQQLTDVTVRNEQSLKEAISSGCGVLIMPNHPSHADPFAIYAAADQVGTPLHIMATWHVFQKQNWLMRRILSWHGCFSVDREANDIGAFRQAVNVLQEKPQPLVIFPEGEIYHCNDRVTPFREGAAAIAVAAARKSKRPIVCMPCAIRYRYTEDPTPSLLQLMDELEQAIYWRPQHQLTLDQRIYRFAEALISLKELEYYGCCQNKSLPDRIRQLGDHILKSVEESLGIGSSDACLPERVKGARRTIIDAMSKASETNDSQEIKKMQDLLEDLFLVVQSFSYPGDYVAAQPTTERMAETLDKFEEDVLRKTTATIRAQRTAVVSMGPAIPVEGGRGKKGYSADLTRTVEQHVQSMLDETLDHVRPADSPNPEPQIADRVASLS